MDQRAGRSFVPAGKGGRQPSCINQQKAVGLGGQVEYSGHLMGNRLSLLSGLPFTLYSDHAGWLPSLSRAMGASGELWFDSVVGGVV